MTYVIRERITSVNSRGNAVGDFVAMIKSKEAKEPIIYSTEYVLLMMK